MKIIICVFISFFVGAFLNANDCDRAIDTYKMQVEKLREKGIPLYDMHIHIRGGLTPEIAANRQIKSGIKSAILANHGIGWELDSDKKLSEFYKYAKTPKIDGKSMLVGIQVNDRDWHKKIDKDILGKFDYILADGMIMQSSEGKAIKLWELERIENPREWMQKYFEHNMEILDEPITIFANPTYLPKCIENMYDELWTNERIEAFVKKAVSKGIVLEIQATRIFQTKERFLMIAKKYGAKFSLGTNNKDIKSVAIDTWLKAIEVGNLTESDFFVPKYK